MRHSEPAPATPRGIRIRWLRVASLLVVIATAATALGYQLLASSSSTGWTRSTPAAAIDDIRTERRAAPATADDAVPDHPPLRQARGGLQGAGGSVPDGTTVFDDGIPGVANLDSGLLRALRQAAGAAADDGVQLVVDSGWRSPEYQERLLREAVAKYGSQAEAARWVATPETSAHVSGDAVDIGPSNATQWLSAHGRRYGLCQVYVNEPWHYELRRDAVDHGCPPMYADPTHDPRMQQ